MLVTAYSKAAERSLMVENQSSSGEYPPELTLPLKTHESLTLEQQIDIECEGYTPSPPIPNKSYSVIQARIQRLRSEDNWLKTSSLPNIRRTASFRRAGRIGAKIINSRTLSYDYTMDEARLRRKSMMLRSIVHWNSGSSDLFSQKQRRFSSVKALPSDHRRSLDDLSRPGNSSFPLTRLIQRRGTFACGDMRTRRMKFLLLLEASESQEEFKESACAGAHPAMTKIRRNSFIPYNTCDKFIAGEEKKTSRDRRRSSVNPFSFPHRFGNTIPQPGTRRHSFFPIRREDKIYMSNPNEQRRHSFNPIGVNNTLKPEFAAKDSVQASGNPEGTSEKVGERRSLHLPPQNSQFLQVPGCDPFMEGRPTVTGHSQSDTGLCYLQHGNTPPSNQSLLEDRRMERRHSFNPVVRSAKVAASGGDGSQLKLPQTKVSEDLSPTGKYLAVPSHDYYIEERERKYSFNTPQKSKATSNSAACKVSEKSPSGRISFKLHTEAQPAHLSPTTISTAMKTFKTSSDSVRPLNLMQETIDLELLPHNPSRSTSPCSNLSCCGSEGVGSEQSVITSRTASISSDRTVKTTVTLSPASVLAADGVSCYGTFQSLAKASDAGIRLADIKPKKPILSLKTMEPGLSSRNVDVFADSSWVRKSASVRNAKERSRRHLETTSVMNSGPATLSPSAITDANAAIQRSKSASALSGFHSAQRTFSYAVADESSTCTRQSEENPTDKMS